MIGVRVLCYERKYEPGRTCMQPLRGVASLSGIQTDKVSGIPSANNGTYDRIDKEG